MCEAGRILAEEIDIEDPEDTAVHNAETADRALGLLSGVPRWSAGERAIGHLVAAARGLHVAADGWTDLRLEVHGEGIGAYLTEIAEAEPMLEALAAEHGRPCPIDGRHPRLEVPA